MRISQHFGVKGGSRAAAMLAVLALLIQALLPAAAMASQTPGQTMVICTLDGMRTVTVDDQGQIQKSQFEKGEAEKGGFAGLPCADCLAATTAAILDPAITITPATYVVQVSIQAIEPPQATPRARGPPRPYGQAPPLL